MSETTAITSRLRPSARKPAGSMRGAAVCLAMFALGGLVLWGLFLAPRGRSPAVPNMPWGAPARPLRFASIDLAGRADAGDTLIEQIRKLDPDYVFVQNIRFDDVHPLAEALGMARSFYPQLFQRASRRSKDAPGDLILSKHTLYDAAPVAQDPGGRNARGVRAVAVFEGVRFVVASGVGAGDDSLRAFDVASKHAGSRPTVLATGWVKRATGEGAYVDDLAPAVTLTQDVAHGGGIPLVATVYADASWATIEGHAVNAPAPGGPTILYAELRGDATSRSDHDDTNQKRNLRSTTRRSGPL